MIASDDIVGGLLHLKYSNVAVNFKNKNINVFLLSKWVIQTRYLHISFF